MPRNGHEENSNDDESGRDDTAPTDLSLSVDATFDVLADSERRVILERLTEVSDGTMGIDELVNELVRWKTDETGELPSPNSVEMRLHHVHLPKLTEVGLVECDVRTGEIRYWGDDRLERWLQRAQAEASS